MCTVLFLYRPEHPWPLLLAGNRDEMRARSAQPPGRYWPDQPDVVAGLDELAGGSWLGVNQAGVVSVVLNRVGSLGPAAGKRSRGELVLQALSRDSAEQAVTLLGGLPGSDYRPFNLLVADASSCYWVRNRGEEESPLVEVITIEPGLHMLTAHELDDEASLRIKTWWPDFQQAATPNPEIGEWNDWLSLMANRSYPLELGPQAAMNIDLPSGFATVSSTLLALPSKESQQALVWLFANSAPDKGEFLPVLL